MKNTLTNETRKCEYRNCELEVTGRSDKKFCTDSHRKMEAVYNAREKKSLEVRKWNYIKRLQYYIMNVEDKDEQAKLMAQYGKMIETGQLK